MEQVTDQPVVGPEQLDAFVNALVKKRDKAIAGRKSSGIEEDWLEDEEYYQGIDDANRSFQRAQYGSKSSVGRASTNAKAEPGGDRSRVFLNITRPYVDAAAARLADMLLPVDERCWAIKPTPVIQIDPQTLAQLASIGISGDKLTSMQAELTASAEAAAELMGDEIDDHLVECGWHGEVRSVIEDCARIGSGILKGPVPQKRTYKRWMMQDTSSKSWPIRIWAFVKQVLSVVGIGDGGLTLQTVEEIEPGSIRVDPWNFYPDEACGQNIHNGSGTWEREYISPKQLRDMRDMPGSNKAAIDKILLEGPKASSTRSEGVDQTPTDGQYERWTHYGVAAKDDAIASGLDFDPENFDAVDIMAVLVNDKMVKLSLNAIETGEYPYDLLAWQARPGMPWGTGIARHIRTPQRMLNAAARAMMDNGGQIAGPQIVIGHGVTPEDGQYVVAGKKLWRANDEIVDVRGAFFAFVPPSMVPTFLEIIEFARSIAEQTTGMPMLLQGQSAPEGGQGQDTLGGMQLLQNNATGVLRRLAKRFDDFLTEPHIRRYYDWLMQYSERDDIKGDFQIDAQGSSALVERDSQKQFMLIAMNYAKDPVYGIDPKKLFAELCKADRLDPEKIQVDADATTGGPSELDQAKTALLEAQAELQKAKTTSENVKSEYEALQAAEAVETMPMIAPVADEILRGAGFPMPNPITTPAPTNIATSIDAIKNHNTGIEFTPGTHPNLPAPPASPGTGAAQGIEGGQQAPVPAVQPQGQ